MATRRVSQASMHAQCGCRQQQGTSALDNATVVTTMIAQGQALGLPVSWERGDQAFLIGHFLDGA